MSRLKKIITRLPYLKRLYNEIEIYKKGFPPGHYYSPIISELEVNAHSDKIFSKSQTLAGIDLNKEEQLKLLTTLQKYYPELPYKEFRNPELRYYFNNNTFEYSDAIFLNAMMRHFSPKKIIEIGSGFSSAVMLDTNKIFFKPSIDLTFIEPYPERLQSLLHKDDVAQFTLIENNLQDVPPELFANLKASDILFVDSTHVSKTGSDVNMILFEILPQLQKGVIIHFHDIFFPFEYPKEWVLGWSGFGWNEIYLLRAFLMNNKEYKIILFNTYLEEIEEDWFRENMPLCLKDKGGSLWIQKI